MAGQRTAEPRKRDRHSPPPPYPVRVPGKIAKFTAEDCERLIGEWRRLAAQATGDDRARLLRLADQMMMIDPAAFEIEAQRIKIK